MKIFLLLCWHSKKRSVLFLLATTLEIKEKEKGALLEPAMNNPELNKEGELKKEKKKKKKVRKIRYTN